VKYFIAGAAVGVIIYMWRVGPPVIIYMWRVGPPDFYNWRDVVAWLMVASLSALLFGLVTWVSYEACIALKWR